MYDDVARLSLKAEHPSPLASCGEDGCSAFFYLYGEDVMSWDNQKRVWITVHSELPGNIMASILVTLANADIEVCVEPDNGYVDLKETDESFFRRVKPEV